MAQTLTFERWHWGPDAAAGLTIAMGRDEPIIAEEIKQGISQLWRVNGGESWLITREEGTELVIVCLQGRNARPIIERVKAKAQAAGFETMRAHTQRRGLQRMFADQGVTVREIVLEMEL